MFTTIKTLWEKHRNKSAIAELTGHAWKTVSKVVKLIESGAGYPEKKPHPMQLLHACQRMGTAPAENLHIGDSRHDAAAARAAGCPVFLVPYGYNEGEDVQGIDCDAIVASLAEAARRIASADFRKIA